MNRSEVNPPGARERDLARLRSMGPAAVVLAVGFALRLYHVTAPPTDFLAWPETESLMAARNFYEHGMNLFAPEVDWRVSMDPMTPGTPRGAELMAVPFLTAILYHVFGVQYWVGRVVSIFFSLLGTYFFYRLADRFYGRAIAFLSAMILTVSPYYLYCGRNQMPEAFAFAMAFAALYTYDRWLSGEGKTWFGLAGLCALLMLLGKPQTVVMALPLAFLTVHRFGWKTVSNWRVYWFAVGVGAPFALYLWWSTQVLSQGTGIRLANSWNFDHGRWLTDPGYYGKIAYSVWSWSITPVVCALGLAGIVFPRPMGRGYFAHWWLLGGLALFFIIPGAAQTNGYLQLILAPPFALLAARALAPLLPRAPGRYVGAAVWVAAMTYSLVVALRLYEPRYTSDEKCGHWIRNNTHPSATVLLASPNPATLYFANRVGWTSYPRSHNEEPQFGSDLINKAVRAGAQFLAIPYESFDNAYYHDFQGIRDALYDTYSCYKGDNFTVFFLTAPADLRLPPGLKLDFGQPGTRIYLRRNWGPDQIDATGEPFITMGPGKSSEIKFTSAAFPKSIEIELAAGTANQEVTSRVNGKFVGTVAIPVSGKRARLTLSKVPPAGRDNLYTITLEASRENRDGVSLVLYLLEAKY